MAVFVDAAGDDLLLHRLSGSVRCICRLGQNPDVIGATPLFERNAQLFAVNPDDAAMAGNAFAVDRQTKDLRQPEQRADTQARAPRRQVIDCASDFLAGRTIFDDAPRGCGPAFVLSALGHEPSGRAETNSRRRSAFAGLYVRGQTGKHVSARPLAGVADECVSLHRTDDWMWSDGDMDHFGPALRAVRAGIVQLDLGHRL